MKTAPAKKIAYIEFSPEHWNQNCQATIPAAFDIIIHDTKYGPRTIGSGETQAEAIQIAEADGYRAVVVA